MRLSVYVFENGMVAACWGDDQVPPLQGREEEVMPAIMALKKYAPFEVDIRRRATDEQ